MTEERQRWEADALREESQRKDRFLAVLAHELRNPLSPILTGVAVLRGRSLPPDSQRHLCDCMDRQVRHLVRLVDDLLDVSRISQGKIVLRKERVELRNTLTQAVESVRNLVDERRHVLAVDVAPEPLVVDGDAVRLVQIVSNLLNNAVRYTPHGGRIHLVLEREASDAVVRVADNGRGIPADLLERVFDIFVQQRGDGRGLGIGLTLVRQLVTLHGGTVRAASPGEDLGSEFVVRLPLAPAAAEVAPAPVDTDIPLEPGLRVVLVEDENDVRLSTTVLLQEWGVDVRVASNGAEGVALIQEQRPDVALVDISMPEMDGFAVARRVHELLGDDAPRLVALTGYGREEDRREGSAAGFDHYLIKPASPHDLRRALRRESDAQDLEHPSAGDDPAGAETHDEGGGGRRSRRHPPSPAGRATGVQARRLPGPAAGRPRGIDGQICQAFNELVETRCPAWARRSSTAAVGRPRGAHAPPPAAARAHGGWARLRRERERAARRPDRPHRRDGAGRHRRRAGRPRADARHRRRGRAAARRVPAPRQSRQRHGRRSSRSSGPR